MPVAASKRQYRMMMAIMHGKVKGGPRGRPPKAVAAKYTSPGEDAVESKDNDRGGSWDEHHHKNHKEGKKTRSKKSLKKAFEEFYTGKGRVAAVLVMDNNSKVLLGTHCRGGLAFPGGHVEPNESFEAAALREMHEESGAIGRLADKIFHGNIDGNEVVVYLGEIASGSVEDTAEIKNWKWYDLADIPWNKLRACCSAPMKKFIETRFGKSLVGMIAIEALEKNIIREKGGAVFEVTHGDALKLVGTGLFRHLKNLVADMTDESFKDIKLDTHTVSIRKHMSDVYSGRVVDGHKMVYQFTNKSLPELCAALMSLFEWYLPEDMEVLDLLSDDDISDDAIEGGLNELVTNFKRHNLGEIYQEMESLREQMRSGMAVDLQQVEMRMTKLFDRLEETTQEITKKHNALAISVGKDMDELEAKLRELQEKLLQPEPKRTSSVVQAYSSNPANNDVVYGRLYSYLSKPKVEIHPTGKITISFGNDWQDLEQSNFLEDMRAKALARK